MEKKETVEVQRAWLEGLFEEVKRAKASQGVVRDMNVAALIGYASSVETILKYSLSAPKEAKIEPWKQS